MGLSGIPWWTTDIGGFHNGVAADPDFKELLIRWFQFGTFCPVMRLHAAASPIPQFITRRASFAREPEPITRYGAMAKRPIRS